jgi:signal peptidase I
LVDKLLRVILWVAAAAAVLLVAGRTVLLDGWVVPDDNKMAAAVAPTLQGGDAVLYMRHNKPAFGDLVRCVDPDDPTRFVVGRVAGLHGDTVETNGRELTVNGTRYTGEMACAEAKLTIPHPTTGSTVDLWCDQVSMGGHPHFRGSNGNVGLASPTKNVVGDGMLFLVSDDRTYHDDSRDFGTVQAASCTGRIIFRVVGKGGWGDDKRRMSFVQ